MGSILTYLGYAKYALPIIDSIIAETKALIPVEKVDIVAAWAAMQKAWNDFKAALEALVTAIKADVEGTTPTPPPAA